MSDRKRDTEMPGVDPGKRSSKAILKEVTHPALIPGIGVDDTPRVFSTNWTVLGIAGVLVLGVVVWGFLAPDSISAAGAASLGWVTENLGWLSSLLAIAIMSTCPRTTPRRRPRRSRGSRPKGSPRRT